MKILTALLALSLALPAAAAPGKPNRKAAQPKTPVAASAADPAFALPLYPATTAEITVSLILERFERFDRGLLTLSGSFRQTVRSDDTGQTQS